MDAARVEAGVNKARITTTPELRASMRAAGVSHQLFRVRLRAGWSPEDAASHAPRSTTPAAKEARARRVEARKRQTAAKHHSAAVARREAREAARDAKRAERVAAREREATARPPSRKALARAARAAEKAARVEAAAKLRRAVFALRDDLIALRGRGAWNRRFLVTFEHVGWFRLEDLADAVGAHPHAAAAAANRCDFIERRDGLCGVVENDALVTFRAGIAAQAAAEEQAEAAARRDGSVLNPWRRRDGNLKTTMFAPAMRALFSDGQERTALDVARAIGHGNASITLGALRRCEEVEEVRDGVWRRIPTREELRAKIAWLEAEVAQLRGAP